MSRMVSFFALIAVIVVIGLLFFRVMSAFFIPLFLACILVVMFRPLHVWFVKKCKHREKVAALLTTLAITLVVLLPAILITTMAVIEGTQLARGQNVNRVIQQFARLREGSLFEMPFAREFNNIESEFDAILNPQERLSVADGLAVLQDMSYRIEHLERRLRTADESIPAADTVFLRESVRQAVVEAERSQNKPLAAALEYHEAVVKARSDFRDLKLQILGGPYRAWLKEVASQKVPQWINHGIRSGQTWLLSVGGATTSYVVGLVVGATIMMIAVYFFFLDGPKMMQSLMRMSPLDDTYEHELLDEFDRISRAVVIATLLSAVVQGLLAGVGFWFSGLNSVFLLVLLTTMLALVPFVGAAAVWVPASLWLYFYEERLGAAIFLAIYGASVVSMADNVIKPWVLHGQSRLHPLLALLSVLGGVQVMGPIGILVGPMIVVFLQTLLNILHRELAKLDQQKATA